jgi:hypothetical protein
MMEKMKLDLDQLNVDSFSTTTRNSPKSGTVHGQGSEWTELESCWGGCGTVSGPAVCECQPLTFGSQETCESQAAVACPADWTDGSCGRESCGPDICV